MLRIVAATPRDEVMDDAVAVLASSADAHETVAALLVELLMHAASAPSPMDAAPAREVLLRALARSSHSIARHARVSVAYRLARQDPSPSVRDAAVQALSMMCEREGRAIVIDLLSKLRADEANSQVRDSIDEAVSTLSGC